MQSIMQRTLYVLIGSVFVGACAGESSNDVVGEATAALSTDGAAGERATSAGAHCRILIEKTNDALGEARIVSRQCYDTEAALLSNQQYEAQSATAKNTILLMTWYADADFRGASTYIEGKDGPCDRDGYGIRNVNGWTDGWNDRISSFKTWNHCNLAVGYRDINYGGPSETWFEADAADEVNVLEVGWVGAIINDEISSIRLQQQ